MLERYSSFNDYVKTYGLQRSEGVLLRYLSQTYKTLIQTVPEEFRNEEVQDVLAYLRTELEHTDSSLISEWESMIVAGDEPTALPQRVSKALDIAADPAVFRRRVRAELHRLVKALSEKNYEEAASCVWQPLDPQDERTWTEERFGRALQPYFDEYEILDATPRARLAEYTLIDSRGERVWRARQILVDPQADNMWFVEASVDLSEPDTAPGPLLRIEQIGC